MRALRYWRSCRGEIWLVILLAAAAIAIGVFYGGQSAEYGFDAAAADGSYEMTVSPAVQELAQELARQRELAKNSSVEIQINGEPVADAHSGRCNLMVGNPEKNQNDFRVTVVLDDGGATVYQSPILKPGEREAYVTLASVPEPGEYRATAEFAVLDPETGTIVGAVDAGIWLAVR